MSGSSGFPGLYSGGQQLNMGSLQNIPRLIVTLLIDCNKNRFGFFSRTTDLKTDFFFRVVPDDFPWKIGGREINQSKNQCSNIITEY